MIDTTCKRKILLLSANPQDNQRLFAGKEIQQIRKAIRGNSGIENLELVDHYSTTIDDFWEVVLDERPQILHFSGHGHLNKNSVKPESLASITPDPNDSGIILEDESGHSQILTLSKLNSLFERFSADGIKLECVFFNCCYSSYHSDVLEKYVPYLIGIKEQISNHSAIEFSKSFYAAIYRGLDYESAFTLAKTTTEAKDTSSEGLFHFHKNPELSNFTFDNEASVLIDQQKIEQEISDPNNSPQLPRTSTLPLQEPEYSSERPQRNRLLSIFVAIISLTAGLITIYSTFFNSSPSNQRPEAVIVTVPEAGQIPFKISFNGSTSEDPDEDSLSYLWEIMKDDSMYFLSTKESDYFTLENAGAYRLALTVSDPGGQKAKSEKIIMGSARPLEKKLTISTDPLWTRYTEVHLDNQFVGHADGVIKVAAGRYKLDLKFHDQSPYGGIWIHTQMVDLREDRHIKVGRNKFNKARK